MRPSNQPLLTPTALDLPSAEFFTEIAKQVPIEHRRGAILLVGGSDFRSGALRRAQAALRFDLRASYWSHAAILLDWPDGDPASATGLEVTLDPAPSALHQPEDNGVTPFALSRYFDPARYPNLCVAIVQGDTKSSDPSAAPQDEGAPESTTPQGMALDAMLLRGNPHWREHVLDAARNPNAARPQFAFYSWLAEWARYSMVPYTVPNPLLEGVPHPGASFIDYVYNAAGLDLVPGASSPNTCPEHLWATFRHWHEHFGERWGALRVWTRIQQKECPS